MTKEVDLTQYRVGHPEAWSPLETEVFLKHRFLPVPQFSEIADPDNPFLCGRRGSGKSAIAIKLEEETSWHYRETIQGEQEQYGVYIDVVKSLSEARTLHSYVDIKRAVQRLWEWILRVKMMQSVVAKQKRMVRQWILILRRWRGTSKTACRLVLTLGLQWDRCWRTLSSLH